VTTRSQHAAQLEEPSVRQLGDVAEHRHGVDETERGVPEGEMRDGAARREPERRRQVLLGPGDRGGVDVHAPDLVAVGVVGEVTHHPTGTTAKVEHVAPGGLVDAVLGEHASQRRHVELA
jgi:hypothetical protein